MEELEFKYEEILTDAGITVNDLPIELRKSINALKPNYTRYLNNPTESMRNSLVQQDVKISNQIYDWLDEKEKADEQAKLEAEEAERIRAEEEAAAKLAQEEEEKRKAEEEAAKLAQEEEEKRKADEAAKSGAKYGFGDADMVSAIQERIEANGGYILIKELKSIIKKEPSYPYQEVHNIKLHKPYMKSFYKLV